MSRRDSLRTLALVALLLCAAGCSFLETKHPLAQVYTLAPALPAASANQPPATVTIKVMHPLCAPGLDSDNIALTRSGQRFDYYAHSRWAAPVPELVQSWAVDALRAAGHFRAVQSDTVPLDADYLLQLEIRRFQAEYQSDEAPVVQRAAGGNAGAWRRSPPDQQCGGGERCARGRQPAAEHQRGVRERLEPGAGAARAAGSAARVVLVGGRTAP